MKENIKVLIIDDEVDFCYFVQKNLMRDGMFDVIIATNGKDGIELAKNEEPDIILLDLFMPDMPGEDVAAALKENPLQQTSRFFMLQRLPRMMILLTVKRIKSEITISCPNRYGQKN